MTKYDALLVVSFGGPEKEEDVMPFLENVLRGKNVPRQRMLEVAEHYYHCGGKSPISDQNRALIAALQQELNSRGPSLPIYWGNRNWHPMLADTLRLMRADGVQRALAFVTSAFGSYSGCRQYREDIERAQIEAGPDTPEVHKLRTFLSDHMEVIYDLDTEASALCRELGINLVRAATVGVHPVFISMIRELILERTSEQQPPALGLLGPGCDVCDRHVASPTAPPGPRSVRPAGG
ncbi:MAG: ferrochelatase [Bryobacteraceae bacterium]